MTMSFGVTRVTEYHHIVGLFVSEAGVGAMMNIQVVGRAAFLAAAIRAMECLTSDVQTPPRRAQILFVAALKDFIADARPEKAPSVHIVQPRRRTP